MTEDSKTEALNFIVPKSRCAVLHMTRQEHILLAFGTSYSDRNVRLMINAPRCVGVTECCRDHHF